MRIASCILFLLPLFSCKGDAVVLSDALPILGETSVDPSTGEAVHYRAPDFVLTGQNGELFSQKDVRGKIHVVDFFFTSCPTICPQMTTHLKDVQEQFEGNDRVSILSYSIDGANDTPEVLSNYAETYGIDQKQWKLLTGNPSDIFELSRGYKVMAFDDSLGNDRNLVHDGTFVLLDSRRRIRGYYNGLDPEDTQRLISDMKILLKTL
jgi:protein SCO1/2